MRITWVNHASFVLDAGAVRLICDPWFEGRSFNNGWSLLSPTKMTYEDFAGLTHIWFSHEHPDHFSPPNLKKIPEQIRRKLTVLFHETRDKRVVNVCKSLGFAVQELPDCKPFTMSPDFTVTCGINEMIDSWISISARGKTLLNLNDCIFAAPQELADLHRMSGKVDLLLSQFSYANWVGNPGDVETHRSHAARKRAAMTAQIKAIQPKQFIPFASYVSFCHRENFYLNDSVNRIGDIYNYLTNDLKQETIVLYPGDSWEVGSPQLSDDAIRNYETDFQNALKADPFTSPQVALVDLQRAMAELLIKCRAKNNPLLLKALPPSCVRVWDLGLDIEVSFRNGIRPVSGKTRDLALSSDSLLYCIKTDWGGETLKINGRFEAPAGGNSERFFRLFRVPQYNGYGSRLDLRFAAGKVIESLRREARN